MVKYTVELPINSSIPILYKCLATPSGLSEWFCDDVDYEQNGKVFVFKWADSEQRAEIIEEEEEEYIRFRWLDHDPEENTYFELLIQVDDITGDVALVVTDFCDEDEVEESKLLWESQAKDLAHNLGA